MSVSEGAEMTSEAASGVEGHRRDRGQLLKMTLKMSRGKKICLLRLKKKTEAKSPVDAPRPKDDFSRAA